MTMQNTNTAEVVSQERDTNENPAVNNETIGADVSDIESRASKTLENMSYLKYLRKKSGYTLEALARVINVSISYLSRLESGSRRLNPELVEKFAQAFNCDPAEFAKDMDETYSYPVCQESIASTERRGRRMGGGNYTDLYNMALPRRDIPAYSLTKGEGNTCYLKITAPESWLFRPSALLGKTVFAILCKSNFLPFFSEKGILYLTGDQNFAPENDVMVCYSDGRVMLKKVWSVTPNALQICDYDKFADLKTRKIKAADVVEDLEITNLPEMYKVIGYSDFKL